MSAEVEICSTENETEQVKSNSTGIPTGEIGVQPLIHVSNWTDSDTSDDELPSIDESNRKKMPRSNAERSISDSPIPDTEPLPAWKNLVDSDSDSDIVSAPPTAMKKQLTILSSNSSDNDDDLPSIHDDYTDPLPIPLSSKKSSSEKVKKLTTKQRDELMKQTLSKTQKMIREKPISLPYEKPKTLSLSEFLAKRAQTKAEFYNPELKKLRPPTPPPISSIPLDLKELNKNQPPSSKKVEDWIYAATLDPIGNNEAIVDTAFDKLDDFLMDDLSLGGDEVDELYQNVSNQQPMDEGCDEEDVSIPCIDLEQIGNTTSSDESLTLAASNLVESERLEAIASCQVNSTEPTEEEGQGVQSFTPSVKSCPIVTSDSAHKIVENPGLAIDEVGIDKPDKSTAASTLDEEFKAKEAALAEYLEANKPKPARKTLAEFLMSDPAYAQVAQLKPKISSHGETVIDFCSKSSKTKSRNPTGIDTLKSRFLKHAAPVRKPKEQHFVVTVTSKEEDSQGNQKVNVKKVDYIQHLHDEDSELNGVTTVSPVRQTPPGVKYNQFRERLKERIRASKAKEYEEKLQNQEKIMEVKKQTDDLDEILDDDNFTTESEPDETDEEAEALRESLRRKKKKVKSAFVEDEAELSGTDSESDLENEDDSEEDGSVQENDDEKVETKNIPKKSKLFRRLKLVIDSSDDEEGIEVVTLDDEPIVESIPTETDSRSGQVEELLIPKEDPELLEFGEHAQPFVSELDFFQMQSQSPGITPAQKKLIERPILPPSESALPLSSLSQIESFVNITDHWDFGIKKSAFTSGLGRFDSDVALDCFQREISTPPSKPLPTEIAKLVLNSASQILSSPTRDLVSICSGVFPSEAPTTPAESQCPEFDLSVGNGKMLTSSSNNRGTSWRGTQTPKVEKDKFKKTRLLFNETNTQDENDDDDEMAVGAQPIKKRHRRLHFSDDEDDEVNVANDSIHDDVDEEESSLQRGYDSEENEIILPKPKMNVKGLVSKSGKIRREFVENEAELSGSEEGSDDEDERGLDQMDEEEGDLEEIDENLIRDQIGQQHIKNLIDDDDRQIRFLQDILLEDGDLHGEGELREKQFKWKNINKLDFSLGDDGEVGGTAGIEDETERAWQEQKAEKARWLKQNSQTAQLIEVNAEMEDSQKIFLENSKYFKFRKSDLKKIQNSCSFLDTSSSSGLNNNSYSETFHEIATDSMPSVRRTSINSQTQALFASPDDPILKFKRGSFLARGSAGLSKIAEMTKASEPKNSIKVNSRNFVFSVITPPGPEQVTGKGKRKNFARHPTSRQEMQRKKMPRIDRSFDSLDATAKANSIFSQF